MNEMTDNYYALRFRSEDTLHRKGDVQFGDDKALYIGQTDECGLRLENHPEYADCCYAVVTKNMEGQGWCLIRQEKEAEITVNGIPLAWVKILKDGDLLKFDKTVIQFTEEHGAQPSMSYVRNRTPWGVWTLMAAIVLVLAGVVAFLFYNNQKPATIYKHEIGSICKVEAGTLLVLSSQNDTLEIISADKPLVGTGFVTENGYFVTARHCVEFWLAMENELRPDIREIQSPIVLWAIEAEADTTIRLVSLLTITSHDGRQTWHFSSDDFTMDKSHDDVYECGDFESSYLWRSVVSMFEKRDAEQGDVAVMKWPYGKGTVKLEKPDRLQAMGNLLCGFGYPQNENRQESVFTSNEGTVYQDQVDPDDCFICEKGFDAGFSGGPVFTKNTNKTVVGIVSRSDGRHTLIVPVQPIYRLISKIEK